MRIQLRMNKQVYMQLHAMAKERGESDGRLVAELVAAELKRAAVNHPAVVQLIASAEVTTVGGLIVEFSDGACLRFSAAELTDWFGPVVDCVAVDAGRGLALQTDDGTAVRYPWDFFSSLLDPKVRKRSNLESARRKQAVARQVRTARRCRKWSVAQLAQNSGVSEAMVRAIGRGGVEVTRKTLESLALALGVPVDELDVEEKP
jgi:DNA-binding Xre family transcriptional regulator